VRVCCLLLAGLLTGCVAISGAPQSAEQSVESLVTDDGACIQNRKALLALDIEIFDHDKSTGWRKIASVEDCESAAAGLIAEYRSRASEEVSDGLRHHQAQLHAAAEEREDAIALLEDVLDDSDNATMRAYHRAEIAFLSGARDDLIAARSELLALPEPAGFAAGVARFKQKYPDFEPPTWPMNLDTINKFVACFGEPYSIAYGSQECKDAALELEFAADGALCFENREALLALDYQTFDMDFERGYRPIAHKQGCQIAVADLISEFHANLRQKGDPIIWDHPEAQITMSETGEVSILYWHEGQIRAFEGQIAEAIELFKLSLEPPEKNTRGWNQYARATVAFLESDMLELQRNRDELARWGPSLNLSVVDGLIACFGQSYIEAYSSEECNRR